MKNFEETTQIKNLKINYIDITNFKNINSISTELGDWNVIGGFNANGKSSMVEAIMTAIQGNKFYGKGAVPASSLVKKGEDEATVSILANGEEQELQIKRVFKKGTIKKPTGDTTLEATLNGEKISQASLDELLNSLTIDPLKLGTLSISDQIKEIKATTGLDTNEIDKKVKFQEECTKETRAFEKQAKAVYENFISDGMPKKVEEKSMSELLEKRKIFDELNDKTSEYSYKNNEVNSLKKQIEDLQKRLILEEKELEEIINQGKEINQKIKSQGLTTLEDLDKEIGEIEKHNNEAKRYKEYLEKKENLLKTGEDFKKDEKKLSDLRAERTQLIANSNLPKYMEISDELGILVDGMEYKLLNTARKIEVGIDLVLISGSPLRLIRIENGGELDTKTLEKIKDKIINNNFQIFIERPIIDKYDSIIINDGEIIEDKEKFINNQ